MDNKVNLTVVANNRKPLSVVGANLGTQYFKVSARASDPDYEKKKIEVEQAGNIPLILNRPVYRYRISGHDILSVMVGTDAAGATKVFLNKDMDGEVSIPVTPGIERIGNVTDDALKKCIRGDQNIIFSDPVKLAQQANVLNLDEKARLVALRDETNKLIAQIDSAVNDNNKKADTYRTELLNSAAEMNLDTTVTVVSE